MLATPALPPRPDVHSAPREPRRPHLGNVAAPERAAAGQAPLVLIAEDHEDSRDALRTLLDALGYRVAEATNGAEAVEQARATRPDVILMDMMMPVVDGFEATRQLRADPAFATVPIIAITAMAGAREGVMEAGCDDFVGKPLDIRAFLEKVRAWAVSGRA